MNPELMNALVLAYIGDGVFEVLVRDYLVLEKKIYKPNDLQKAAIQYVSAKGQAAFIRYAKEKEILSEEEVLVYKRGRNAKGRKIVKNMDIQTHNESSGFEAIFGLLHLTNRQDRIKELFDIYKDYIENGE